MADLSHPPVEVTKPRRRLAAVLASSSLYSKTEPGIFMYTVPDSPGGRLLPSTSTTVTSQPGQARPTVPGFWSQSAADTTVPPPSVAA